MKKCLLASAVVGIVLSISSASGQSLDELQKRITEVRERLDLSEEQIEQLSPVFKDYFKAQIELLMELGVNLESQESDEGIDIKQLQGLEQKIREANADFETEIAASLSDEQLEEFVALQQEQKDRIRDKVLERRIEQLAEQIELNDDQTDQFKTIYSGHTAAQMEILEKHGIKFSGTDKNRVGLRKLLDLRKDLKAADEKSISLLSTILSDEQLDNYKKIQKEQRERINKLIR